MKERRNSLTWSTLYILFIANLLATKIDALLCYCTEEECLSGDRSNMCVQDDPTLGCYKQYYSKMEPAITMGCVKYSLLCDSSRIRPGPYKSEWPNAACCFTDHCNRNLPLPILNETGIVEDTTKAAPTVSTTQSKSTAKTTKRNPDEDMYSSDPETESSVHPAFMLVMILVYIFLIAVMASILVIVKVWFYRRKKSKPQKHWIIQRNMLHTKAQMSHLLTDEPYESAAICLQSNSSSMVSAFDVP